jgi:hypothetical protein
MEILTAKTTRRSTRLRVEIPVHVASLDRMRPFAGECVVLVASAQGCGIQCAQALQVETPIMITGLPGGASVTAKVANCVPLGADGKKFLVGASLYTHGNIWGIPNPPEDWGFTSTSAPAASPAKSQPLTSPQRNANRKTWPYNLFEEGAESHPGRK